MGYKYKVLHVSPSFPPDKGGIANHVSNLCTYLTKQGDNISIIAPKSINNKTESTVKGFEHIHRISSFYLTRWPYPTLRSVSIPIDLGIRMHSFIQKGSFDIIHAHGHHYPISWLAINYARKYDIPSVLTLHGGMYSLNPYNLGGKTIFEQVFNKYVLSRILAATDAVVGLTKQITDFAKEFSRQSTTKYLTIPNGVNTYIYKENLIRKKEYRLKYGLRQDSLVILFSGRFEHVKGIIEFTKAVKKIIKNKGKDIEVVIVGSGTLENDIKSILHDTDNIHMLGWQPPDHIHEIYIASDIFVNPSKFEGLPITIIEAMNACLHIVYTPVGGVPDILQGYSPKTMLTKTSSDEIQKVLSTLLDRYNSLSTTNDIGNSFAYAQKFDWNNIAYQINCVYKELRL